MTWPVADFRGAVRDCSGHMTSFIPSYMPFKLLVSANLYAIAQLELEVIYTMPWNLLDFVLGHLKHLECPLIGWAFVGGKGTPFLVNEGLYLVQVGLKPILCFCLFFAKGQWSSIVDVISEVFPSLSSTCIGWASSTTLTNSFTISGLRVIHVLIRCLPACLAWCTLLSLKFTLQQTRKGSVSQSALW